MKTCCAVMIRDRCAAVYRCAGHGCGGWSRGRCFIRCSAPHPHHLAGLPQEGDEEI